MYPISNLEKHGVVAVKTLYEYIADNNIPEKSIRISPSIILSSNIDEYYLDNE